MTHDFKAALVEMIDGRAGVGDWFLRHKEAIRHALRIADKLMQEPSDEMLFAPYYITEYTHLYDSIFKAMRDQMLSEL